jgi:hypothetical protein
MRGLGGNRADDFRCDANDVPELNLLGFVVKQDPTGAGDDDIGFLLLVMAVSRGGAQIWCVPKETHPEVTGLQVLAAEASLDSLHPGGGILDLEHVDLRETGHAISWVRHRINPAGRS